MELYFLRHGLAAKRSATQYPDDSLRPLTAEGYRWWFEKIQAALLGAGVILK